MNQIRIEAKGNQFVVQFVENGKVQDMDSRNTYKDAEDFAFYLAERLKLDVFYQGQKVNPPRSKG
ncbi:hypothetical protein [Cohnella zeiphila]|uniref:Uncharacterized protein n=1 Tax=Cohnella zeiphila TaxID=2761120 RepID=A0A7X0SMM6_9BACL|nr:hypothetical protein [Cohnella zeiphila]MBB6732785.1 hypothetical protein [Cohnella zeiphila]